MKPVIELKHVTKTIGKKKIIDDLSLEVFEGEVFGFLGPNGAGKTTTIRMMTGLMKLSSGEIIINGTNIKKNFEKALAQIGAIVENPELYKFLSGYQNLMQAARLLSGVTKEKINEIIELVGLTDRINDKVKTYSLGMRQRLGIAICLLHNPKVLILDEPTNGLDPAGIREVRNHLRNLAKEKDMAIIVSSHLLSEMEMMCDRIAIIQKGKLINVQNVRTETELDVTTYFIQVDKKSDANHLLNESGYSPLVKENGIEVVLERSHVPGVIKLLVENDILIYEVKGMTKSLEDRFLEITSDKEVIVNA